MLGVVIVAGGSGARFNSPIPKQYHMIGQEMALKRAVNAFLPFSENLIVVIREDDEEIFIKHLPGIKYVFGGKTRQESVLKGLEHLEKTSPKFVLISDGARPFVSRALIQRTISKLEEGSLGVVPCLGVNDCVKKISGNVIEKTLDRKELALAQTPQGFDFKLILSLHKKYAGLDLPDDGSLPVLEGIFPVLVQGEKSNIKITFLEDLQNEV